MQGKVRDSPAYYSCDDHFVVVDKSIDCGQRESKSYNRSYFRDQGQSKYNIPTSHRQGISSLLLLQIYEREIKI